MCIKLEIKRRDEKSAKLLGGIWLPDAKTWVIPDGVEYINPFGEWLPKTEGFIVQRPYFVNRAKRVCYKCGKETPLIAPGIKFGYQLTYETKVWKTSLSRVDVIFPAEQGSWRSGLW